MGTNLKLTDEWYNVDAQSVKQQFEPLLDKLKTKASIRLLELFEELEKITSNRLGMQVHAHLIENQTDKELASLLVKTFGDRIVYDAQYSKDTPVERIIHDKLDGDLSTPLKFTFTNGYSLYVGFETVGKQAYNVQALSWGLYDAELNSVYHTITPAKCSLESVQDIVRVAEKLNHNCNQMSISLAQSAEIVSDWMETHSPDFLVQACELEADGWHVKVHDQQQPQEDVVFIVNEQSIFNERGDDLLEFEPDDHTEAMKQKWYPDKVEENGIDL